MKQFVLIACFIATITSAYEVIQDENGDVYYLVPLSRQRRSDIAWDVQDPSRVKLKLEENIFKDDKHKVDATVFGSKNLKNWQEPLAKGGKISYKNLPTGSTVSVFGQNRGKMGNDYGLETNWNLLKKGPLSVDLTGQYSRHSGGSVPLPPQIKNPQWSTFLSGTINY